MYLDCHCSARLPITRPCRARWLVDILIALERLLFHHRWSVHITGYARTEVGLLSSSTLNSYASSTHLFQRKPSHVTLNRPIQEFDHWSRVMKRRALLSLSVACKQGDTDAAVASRQSGFQERSRYRAMLRRKRETFGVQLLRHNQLIIPFSVKDASYSGRLSLSDHFVPFSKVNNQTMVKVTSEMLANRYKSNKSTNSMVTLLLASDAPIASISRFDHWT